MKILVVVPHYFGPRHAENYAATLGSYVDPLGRIAGLNQLIVRLHGQFGATGLGSDGAPIISKPGAMDKRLDIVIVTLREHGILDALGVDPAIYTVEYARCDPPWLPFEAQRIFRERFGEYDFYCFMEDDLSIHDPAFFEKLTWFQANFGYRCLLLPVRYELPAIGRPIRCIIDPELPDSAFAPFRRSGQVRQLEASWYGQRQTFTLPSNPHAASFFLTREQLGYWMKQPTFDDRDDSWIGPLESAATLSIGRVFDVYKPLFPDPFFIAVEHFGARYASEQQAENGRYGEDPMLAIAQNAIRMANKKNLDGSTSDDNSLSQLIRECLKTGTVMENLGLKQRLEKLTGEVAHLNNKAIQIGQALQRSEDKLREQSAKTRELNTLLKRERQLATSRTRSVSWLLRALRDEIKRRSGRRLERSTRE